MDITGNTIPSQFWFQFRNEIRAVIWKDVPLMVRQQLREEMPTIVSEGISKNPLMQTLVTDVRELKTDMKDVKAIQLAHSAEFQAVRADTRSLKNTARAHSKEIHTLGILLEDLDHRFSAVDEAN